MTQLTKIWIQLMNDLFIFYAGTNVIQPISVLFIQEISFQVTKILLNEYDF